MKHLLALLIGGVLPAGAAHAQATFCFGPQVSLVRSTVYNTSDTNPYRLSGRTGLEAGLAGFLQLRHFAFQPAILYSQQGFASEQLPLPGGASPSTGTTRLDYLRIPLQAAYTQHANGQGLQFFAGPYLGLLLGGRTKLDYGNGQATGGVVVTETHTEQITPYSSTRYPDYNFYGRRLDLGAQAGVGYRLGGALLQVSYSQGLRRVNSAEQYAISGGVPYDINSPNYRPRSVQASLSYLFGPGS